MTTLTSVYHTKDNRAAIDRTISILEQAGIQSFTTGITVNDQTMKEMYVYVQSHEQEKAELLLDEVYEMGQVKLPGEFVCLELRNEDGGIKGLNIFYTGVLQHTWHPVEPLYKK